MIIDGLLTFANNTSLSGSSGATVNVGDVVDLEGLGGSPLQSGGQRSAGDGFPLFLVIKTTAPVVAAGAGTITVRVVSDSVTTPATDGSATVHYTTGPLTTGVTSPAPLDGSSVIAVLPLPLEGPEYERYLGIQVAIASNNVTSGGLDAFLTLDPTAYKAYPDAVDWS